MPTPQLPPAHTASEVSGSAQTIPHPPQFAGSVRIAASHPSALVPLQSRWSAGHVVIDVHAPETHATRSTAVDAMHAWPHAPQFAASSSVRASQPSAALPLQSAQPASQRATVHTPAAQPAVACGTLQRTAHAPQCAGFVATSASQPFAASPSQSAWPAVHAARTHAPSAHTATAPCTSQRRAQSPQWFGSERRSLHVAPHAVCVAGHCNAQRAPAVPPSTDDEPCTHRSAPTQTVPHAPQ